MVSVTLHGIAATPLGGWYGKQRTESVLPEERESSAAGLFLGPATDVPRITPDALARLLREPDPPLVLDVRTGAQERRDGVRIPGGVRVPPDEVAVWARDQDRARQVVAYCT
jgi:hypothetical protein